MTPDAQRTMGTHLGACVELGPADIDPDFIASARLLYMEGYLWDPPAAKKAFRKALRIAHAAGGRVCLSLSDSFCVDRHRAELRDLVSNHIDVLFANEDEAMALYEVRDFDAALAAARADCAIAASPAAPRAPWSQAKARSTPSSGAHRPAGRIPPALATSTPQASSWDWLGVSTSPAAAASPRSRPGRSSATTAPGRSGHRPLRRREPTSALARISPQSHSLRDSKFRAHDLSGVRDSGPWCSVG